MSIKPALTAEEWAEEASHQDAAGWPLGDPRARVGFDGEGWHPARHALAALCLHGQPFGFTREMVKAIRACAITADCDRMMDAECDLAMAAIDRIEALLPPTEETTP